MAEDAVLVESYKNMQVAENMGPKQFGQMEKFYWLEGQIHHKMLLVGRAKSKLSHWLG